MNASHIILACIAPVVVLALLFFGAPGQRHYNAPDSVPADELPAPTTNKYAVRTDDRLTRVNHLRAGSFKLRTEVDNTHTPFGKSKAQAYEDGRALGYSQRMQQPLRNLNDAQASFQQWDAGEPSNFMGKVEVRRPKPFVEKTERGAERGALRMGGVRFQGQDYARSTQAIGMRDQPAPKPKRVNDAMRPQLSRGSGRALALPVRGVERLRLTKRDVRAPL